MSRDGIMIEEIWFTYPFHKVPIVDNRILTWLCVPCVDLVSKDSKKQHEAKTAHMVNMGRIDERGFPPKKRQDVLKLWDRTIKEIEKETSE